MILDQETFEKYGYLPINATAHKKIVCKCDFCGDNFERKKHKIERSHVVTKTDSCGKKDCSLKKRKESFLKKHGFDNAAKISEFKEKIKQTNLKKHGVEYPMQNKEIQEKSKKSCLENHGVERPLQNKEIQEKMKQTNLKKYGVVFTTQSKEIQGKMKSSTIKNHGVENVFQSKKIKEKIKQTNLKKYSVEHTMQNKEIQEKRKKTCLKNHGVEYPAQSLECMQKMIRTCIEKHGTYPFNNFGRTQQHIQDRLNALGFSFKPDRIILCGKEIDMYDEKTKVGIEYCGLFWHNEHSPVPRHQNYHYNKYKILERIGVKLLTIFEDEWLEKETQCFEYIKKELGIFERVLNSEFCTVEELDIEKSQQFLNEYHIQGKINFFVVGFGLFYKNELVGVMSMGKCHDHRNITMECICFKHGVFVNDGTNKLLIYCKNWARINGYQEIVSFSDNRWDSGELHKNIGFVFEKELDPDYSYVVLKNPGKRICKEHLPVNKSEEAWIVEQNIAKIWDCGKKQWTLKIPH